MKVQDFSITDEFHDIVQIGFVVEDLAKVRQAMLDVFGLEPDSSGLMPFKDCTYKYSDELIDAPVYADFYNFFNIQLEFLQPTGDHDDIWSDYLKLGQHGLHHIRFDVDDNDRANKLMADKGIGIWMEGPSIKTPGARFTYYDSLDKLGFIVEGVTRAK